MRFVIKVEWVCCKKSDYARKYNLFLTAFYNQVHDALSVPRTPRTAHFVTPTLYSQISWNNGTCRTIVRIYSNLLFFFQSLVLSIKAARSV